MLNTTARLALTSTAIAPVLLTYSWVAYNSNQITVLFILLAVCFLLLCICKFLLSYCKKNLERINFKIISVEVADRENIGFLILYLFPLFTSQLDAINWQFVIPAILVFGLVVATGYNYHFNPLLGLMGWHFYKVGTPEGVTYVIITKKQLRNAIDEIEVGQLTEYIIIDMED